MKGLNNSHLRGGSVLLLTKSISLSHLCIEEPINLKISMSGTHVNETLMVGPYRY